METFRPRLTKHWVYLLCNTCQKPYKEKRKEDEGVRGYCPPCFKEISWRVDHAREIALQASQRTHAGGYNMIGRGRNKEDGSPSRRSVFIPEVYTVSPNSDHVRRVGGVRLKQGSWNRV